MDLSGAKLDLPYLSRIMQHHDLNHTLNFNKKKRKNAKKKEVRFLEKEIPKLIVTQVSRDLADAETNGFKINVPGICVINGKPGSGKSTLEKYIMYIHQDKFIQGLSVSGTSFDPQNLSYVPPEMKTMEYNPARLASLMQMQEKIPKEERKCIYFIIDDYICDNNLWFDRTFKTFVTCIRHYHGFIIICTQHINKVPPIIREAAFQACIFHVDTQSSMKAAYESYGSGFETEKDFRNFNKKLEQYHFLFVNKAVPSDEHPIMKSPEKVPDFMLYTPPVKAPRKKQRNKK